MRFVKTILAFSIGLAFTVNATVADTPDSTVSKLGAPPADFTPPMEDGPHDLAKLYPPEARRKKEEGNVFIVFTVRKDGSVAEASVMRSSGFADLDHVALEAVKTWRYRPATAGGQPIEVRWRTYVDFQLPDSTPPSNITPVQAVGPPHNVMTYYPDSARRLREEGTATIRFTVAVDGTVSSASVMRSSGFADLDDAATEAVKTWLFKPATQDGKPIAVSSAVNLKFQIVDGDDGPPPERPYTELFMSAADYPRHALAAKEEGRTKLSIWVEEDGSVKSVDVTDSSGSQSLDDASVALVKRWHFTAATHDGKPMKTIIWMIVNWALPAGH